MPHCRQSFLPFGPLFQFHPSSPPLYAQQPLAARSIHRGVPETREVQPPPGPAPHASSPFGISPPGAEFGRRPPGPPHPKQQQHHYHHHPLGCLPLCFLLFPLGLCLVCWPALSQIPQFPGVRLPGGLNLTITTSTRADVTHAPLVSRRQPNDSRLTPSDLCARTLPFLFSFFSRPPAPRRKHSKQDTQGKPRHLNIDAKPRLIKRSSARARAAPFMAP